MVRSVDSHSQSTDAQVDSANPNWRRASTTVGDGSIGWLPPPAEDPGAVDGLEADGAVDVPRDRVGIVAAWVDHDLAPARFAQPVHRLGAEGRAEAERTVSRIRSERLDLGRTGRRVEPGDAEGEHADGLSQDRHRFK